MLLEETPELAAQDPQAPAADDATQNDTTSQHTPEDSVLLTPEQSSRRWIPARWRMPKRSAST